MGADVKAGVCLGYSLMISDPIFIIVYAWSKVKLRRQYDLFKTISLMSSRFVKRRRPKTGDSGKLPESDFLT